MRRLLSRAYLLSYLISLIISIVSIFNIKDGIADWVNIGSEITILLNIIIFVINRKYETKYLRLFLIILFLFILGRIFHFVVIPNSLIVLCSLILNINLLNIKKFVTYDISAKGIIFILALILNIIGVLPNSINDIGDSFGFLYANGAGTIVLSIIWSLMLLLCTKQLINKDNIIYSNSILLISTFIILFFYYFTKSRALLISGIFIIIMILLKHSKIIKCIVFKIATPISVIACVISISFPYMFNPLNNVWQKINNIFSNRLILQSLFINIKPLKLYGQHMPKYIFQGFSNGLLNGWNIGTFTDIRIDNFYLTTAFFYGFIGLILVLFLFFNIMHDAVKELEYIPCILLLSLIIYSCIESDSLAIYNIAPILYVLAISEGSTLKYSKFKRR